MQCAFRTNYSKHLKGIWVSPVDDRHYRVHDCDGVNLWTFAAAMSQNTRLAFKDEDHWREQVRRLLAQGASHGFPVQDSVVDLLDELGILEV
jgi:hypothetical protein